MIFLNDATIQHGGIKLRMANWLIVLPSNGTRLPSVDQVSTKYFSEGEGTWDEDGVQ